MGETLVVPVGTPDARASIEAASDVEAALTDARWRVISRHDARDRFASRSRLPRALAEADVDQLSRAAQEAIEHVTYGRSGLGEKAARDVLARAEGTLETLNRDTLVARRILDVCLSLVRNTLHTGNRQAALDQAMRCRHLVPDLVPTRTAQPAHVIGVLVEADELLARMRTGNLTVQSTPSSGCDVYLNGRHLGTTPFRLERAAPGEYRVQLECAGTPTRVHLIQLGDEPAELLVDSEFDRAVANETRLVLRYESVQRARTHAVAGAISLGCEVGAEEILYVAIGASGQAELLRVQVHQGRMVGRASVRWNEARGFEPTELARAITTLAEARVQGTPSLAANLAVSDSVDAPARPVVARTPLPTEGRLGEAEPTPGVPGSAPAHRPGYVRKLTLGLTAFAVGTGMFVGAGLSARQRGRAGHDLRSLPDSESDLYGDLYVRLVNQWEEPRVPFYVFAAIGSATLTSSALGLLLCSAGRTIPLWTSLASAGVALGLMSWGIAEVARGGVCPPSELDRRSCSDDLEQRDRGALLLMAAAPPLAIPLARLVHRSPRPERALTRVTPVLDPVRKAFSLQADVRWF